MKLERAKLLMLGQDATVQRLLRGAFDVDVLSEGNGFLADGGALAATMCGYSTYVIATPCAPLLQSRLIDAVVCDGAVLVVAGDGLCGDAAWCDLLGIKLSDTCPAVREVRVFPHILTRGLSEREAVDGSLPHALPCTGLGVEDNIFLRSEAGLPLAYERVHGHRGRVVVMLMSGRDGLSTVERGMFANLHGLRRMSALIDRAFSSPLDGSIPFVPGRTCEPKHEVGRWNALVAGPSGDAFYTHSSLFLPMSPEHYLRKSEGTLDREALVRGLASVELRNTDFCNQDCYYCYNRKSMGLDYARTALPDDVHLALEDDLIRLRAAGGEFMLRYSGAGEPTAHRRTIPSLLRFEAAGIPTLLITNGAGIPTEQAAALGENASYVRFSIDAACAESYSRIRRCDVAIYGRVLENIRTMAHGKPLIGATFLVCRENYTQVEAFCAAMRDCGVEIVWIRSTNDPEDFSEAEIASINQSLERAQQGAGDDFAVFTTQFTLYRAFSGLHYRYADIPCHAGRMKAVVQPNGAVAVCLSRKDFVLGSLHEAEFSEIWGGAWHVEFLRSSGWDSCSQCIESRFNAAVAFMRGHRGEKLRKTWRSVDSK